MSDPRRGLALSTLHVAAWNGIRLLVQLAWLVLLARSLGAEDYGQFIGIASLGVAAGGFAGLGMGLRMYRDTASGADVLVHGWGRMLGVMAWTAPVLFAVTLALAMLGLGPLDPLVAACLLLSEVVVAPIVTQVAFAHAGAGEMGRSAAVPSVLACARLLGLMVLPAGADFRELALMYLMATMVGVSCVLALSAPRLRLGLRPIAARWAEVREGLSYSGLWASGLAVGSLDKSLVLKWGGDGVAGHYSIGQRLAAIVATPVEALAAAALPRLFKGQGGEHGLSLGVGWLAAVALGYGIAAGAVVWACAPLAQVPLGPEFAAVASLGPSMAGYVVLYCMRVMGGSILLGRGLVAWRLVFEGVSLAVFAILAFAWARNGGALGAMAALLVMEACMVLVFWTRIAAPRREDQHGA